MPSLMSRRVSPEPQAIARVLLGVAALVTAVELHLILVKVAGGAVAIPSLALPWSVTPAVATAWLAVTVLASVALAIGWYSKAAAAAVAGCFVLVLVLEQQTYSNHVFLMISMCALMACGQPGAAWSVDARGRSREQVAYWPQFLLMMQVSVLYFFAAASKVNEVFLSGAVLEDTVWLPLPAAMFTLLSVGAVLTEFALAFGLWLTRWWWVAAAAGVGLHASIVLTMRAPAPLFAFALLALAVYPMFRQRARLAAARRRDMSGAVDAAPATSLASAMAA